MAIPEQPERIDDLRTRVAKSRLASAVLEVVRGKAIAEVAKRYGLSPRELGHAEKIALEAILGASEPTASGHWLVADTDLLVSGFNFGYPFCPEPKVLIDRVIPMAAIRTSTRLRRNKWGMTLGLKAQFHLTILEALKLGNHLYMGDPRLRLLRFLSYLLSPAMYNKPSLHVIAVLGVLYGRSPDSIEEVFAKLKAQPGVDGDGLGDVEMKLSNIKARLWGCSASDLIRYPVMPKPNLVTFVLEHLDPTGVFGAQQINHLPKEFPAFRAIRDVRDPLDGVQRAWHRHASHAVLHKSCLDTAVAWVDEERYTDWFMPSWVPAKTVEAWKPPAVPVTNADELRARVWFALRQSARAALSEEWKAVRDPLGGAT